jgi:hypothetical protein
MKMRRTVRNAWVKALRSGEYQQTEGALCKVVDTYDGEPVLGFCCLGVLSELAIKHGASVSVDEFAGDLYEPARTYDGEENFPPYAVAKWALGTDERTNWDVRYVDPDEDLDTHSALADRNDGGATFREIADLIENDLDAVDDIRDDQAEVTA